MKQRINLLALILLIRSVVPAQTDESSPDAFSLPGASLEAEALSSLVTLNMQNATLQDVLGLLAKRSGMNFVSARDLAVKTITINLRETPLIQAIHFAVSSAGLSYHIVGSTIQVGTMEDFDRNVFRTGYVFQLQYIDAEEAAGLLSDFGSQIKANVTGNNLVVYGPRHALFEIEKVLKAIDHPPIQILLETRLIEVYMDRLTTIGINWSQLGSVSLEAAHPGVAIDKNIALNRWALMPLQLKTAIDMIAEDGDARILMDSKLTTINKRPAKMHIGEVIPYTVQAYNPSAGGGVNLEIKEKEIGVMLQMTPYVNRDEEVTLTIQPEVSTIAGWKGPNSDLPLVSVRRATTTVRVKSGQTVFIAGLLSDEKTVERRKLPILGDIPLLGIPFRNVSKKTRKKNLIIQITPHIIHESSTLMTSPEILVPFGAAVSDTAENTRRFRWWKRRE